MIVIDCSQITSFEDFVAAFNEALIEPAGGKWNGNLAAFNDYLSWPRPVPYRIVLLSSERCADVLAYPHRGGHDMELWTIIREIFDDNRQFVSVEFA